MNIAPFRLEGIRKAAGGAGAITSLLLADQELRGHRDTTDDPGSLPEPLSAYHVFGLLEALDCCITEIDRLAEVDVGDAA